MKISIIVPIYNVENYLEECITSALNQTMDYSEYEVILVNDGSMDGSKIIAERYAMKYPNIKLINQENQGLSAARNAGMKCSAGKYIVFLDSDDLFGDENMLEYCYKMCEVNNLEVLMFNGNEFINDNINMRDDKLNYYNFKDTVNEHVIMTGRQYFDIYYVKGKYRVPVWLYILSNKFIKDNGLEFVNGLIHEDEEFSFKVLFYAKRIKYSSRVFYLYRRRTNSITNNNISKRGCLSLIYILYLNSLLINKERKNLSHMESKLLNRYLLDYYFNFIKYIMQNHRVRNNFINFLNRKFWAIYYLRFNPNLEFNEILVIRKVMDYFKSEKINCNIERIIKNTYCLKKNLNLICYLETEEKKIIIKKLNEISFKDSEKTIGIYGIGSHTKNLIDFYQDNIGNIKSNIIFIDTNRKSLDEKFMNRNIINVKDVHQYNINEIVLSSISFESDMLEMLNKYNYKNKVHKFYQNGEKYLFTNCKIK